MQDSERAEVFFSPYTRNRAFLRELRALFSKVGEAVSPGDSVAVKVHMGEYGGSAFLPPPVVRRVCDLIKEKGGRPFVTDTTTLYPGRRFTAAQYMATATFNGFTAESVGSPIVIAGGEEGYDGEWVDNAACVSGCTLDRTKVATEFMNADCMVVLSHVKGHPMSGFGGAIKNVAMGCVTKESKADQHRMNRGIIDFSKCTGCGDCVEACSYGAMSLSDDRMARDEEKCMSCNHCFFLCTEGVFSLPPEARERFSVYLAHAASGVLRRFGARAAFINFVQDVTPLCDCVAPSGLPVVPDIGILASTDPVAVDKASLDLIARARPLGKYADVAPGDILGHINRTESVIQVRTAAELGLGNMEYRLQELE